jgi:hypothetical protein
MTTTAQGSIRLRGEPFAREVKRLDGVVDSLPGRQVLFGEAELAVPAGALQSDTPLMKFRRQSVTKPSGLSSTLPPRLGEVNLQPGG